MRQKLYYKNLILDLLDACAFPVGYFEDFYLDSALNICRAWMDNRTQSFQIHSSGSTGAPKQIVLSRRQILASANATIAFLKIQKHTNALVCLSTLHIGGQMMLIRSLEACLHIYLEQPSSWPTASFEKLPEDGFSFGAFVPLQWENMVKNQEFTNRIFAQSAGVLLGGAPVNNTLMHSCTQFDFPIFHTYGMSETVSHIALRQLAPHPQLAFTLLPQIFAYSNSAGKLQICAPQTDDKWLNTNDIVEWIDDRNFVWLGRADRIINSGGIKILPETIEKTILELLLFVSDCLVLPLNDERLGQKAVGVLQASKPISEIEYENFRAIIITLKHKLPKYNLPAQWFFVEKFPKLSSGKTDMRNVGQIITELEAKHDYVKF